MRTATITFLSVASAAVAYAQEAAVPATEAAADPAPSTFVTLDRLDTTSRMNTSAGFTFFSDDSLDAINFALHTDIWGHYVHQTGAAAYASIPVTHLNAEGDASESAIGNIEVGGGYVQSGQIGFALRGGLLLPTADDDLDGTLTNVISTAAPRLTDMTTSLPDTTWLRLSASPLVRSGSLFLRADLGVDIALDEPDGVDIDPLVRANVGAGILAGQLALTGEVVTVGTTGDVDDESERFIHTAGVSARFDAGRAKPGLAVVTPLDDEGRGEMWAAILDVSISLE